jgi:hypothetical protein
VSLEAQCEADTILDQTATKSEIRLAKRERDQISKVMWIVPVAVIVVFLLIEGMSLFMIAGLGGIGALAWWLYKR